MKRLKLPRAVRRAPAVPRVNLAAAPYVLGRDERGRVIYSSRPTLSRQG
jgi:hypothetical protein